jgi:hypothetical protein
MWVLCPLERSSHCLIKVVNKSENSSFEVILTFEAGTFE